MESNPPGSLTPSRIPTQQLTNRVPERQKCGAVGMKSHIFIWEVCPPDACLPNLLSYPIQKAEGQAAITLLPQRFLGCELVLPLGPGQGHSEATTTLGLTHSPHSPHLLGVGPCATIPVVGLPEKANYRPRPQDMHAQVLASLGVNFSFLCEVRPSVALHRDDRSYKQAGQVWCTFL